MEDLTLDPQLVELPSSATAELGATWYEGKVRRRIPAQRKNPLRTIRNQRSGEVREVREPWAPPVDLGEFMRVRARDGYSLVVKEISPGLYLVGATPNASERVAAELGFVGPAVSAVTELIKMVAAPIKRATDRARERKGGAEPTDQDTADEIERAAATTAPQLAGRGCGCGCGCRR